VTTRTAEVWLPLDGNSGIPGAYSRVGMLYANSARGGITASFRYDPEWLGHPRAYSFDPAYPLGSGTQHHPAGGFAGAFSDAQPDRWGRGIILRDRRARGLAAPDELDLLLGIDDELRMGALRFTEPGSREFLTQGSRDSGRRIPPLTELAHLARLSERAEADPAFDDLRALAEAGSSLGGARPKVNVIDTDGTLSIAKFSSIGDDLSTIAWEHVALHLAGRAGIRTPKHRLLHIGGRPVLLMERFDRVHSKTIGATDKTGISQRIPYISTMTLLRQTDGNSSSYAEIAEELTVPADRRELFRRAALGLLIGNTDDHLRNHGLLRLNGAWRLSPAFDINPGTQKHQHATAISPLGPDAIETLLDSSDSFSLTREAALASLSAVIDATRSWREEATRARIPATEHALLAGVFESKHLEAARQAVRGPR